MLLTFAKFARRTVLLLLLVTAAMSVQQRVARAQPAPQPRSGTAVGSLKATGSTWNFDGDLTAAGPWTFVTVTNTTCATPYRPGTAQAGAIIFTGQLTRTQTQTALAIYEGDLLPFRGSQAQGHVRVTTPAGANPETHVDARIWGLEMFALENTFTVCLTPRLPSSVAALITADAQQVVALGYDVTGVVTTSSPDGGTLVALSGVKTPTADGDTQWVFFFNDATYLGTDTALPSPQLSLAGSPGPGQVDVHYTTYALNDPLCCPSLPPVTITYTWDGERLTPSGTPPGH